MDISSMIDYFFENYFIFYSKEDIINITFSGGESLFFADELFAYIKQIRDYNNVLQATVKITIQTNGSLITSEIIKLLTQYNVEVFFSYDGYGQNITRKQNQLVFHNLKELSTKVPVAVNSVITPETSQYLYQTYKLLQETDIIGWGFSINFLEPEENYDKDLLEQEVIKIKNTKSNFAIKNFLHQQDEEEWQESILSYISQITITTDGWIKPTNFIFTGDKYTEFFNYNFGNVKNNTFDEKKFIAYCNEKIELLKNMPLAPKTDIITPRLIVQNLFNTTSRFVEQQKDECK